MNEKNGNKNGGQLIIATACFLLLLQQTHCQIRSLSYSTKSSCCEETQHDAWGCTGMQMLALIALYSQEAKDTQKKTLLRIISILI